MIIAVVAVCAIILAFDRPPYPLLRDARGVIGVVAAAVALPILAGLWTSRRTLRLLERDPEDPGLGQTALGRGTTITTGLLAVSHAALLTGTSWMALCRRAPVVGDWLIVPSLLAGLPFMATILLIWIVTYPAYRAVRQIALETWVFRNKPVHPVWGLLDYLAFNLRHQVLFIVAPMLLILVARDLVTHYERALTRLGGSNFLPELLLGAATAVVAVIAPVILRHVWITHPLPEGPLRDRLVHLCRRLRLRYREILVWRSGGMIVNAAVMGVLAPFRYLMITDGMIEQMDDQKIEAVFGHEAGHVKRHHILFFLLFALISGALVTVAGAIGEPLTRQERQSVSIGLGVVLAVQWGVLFGWVSRRFERQADVFGVRTLALAGVACTPPCALHDAQAPGRDAGGARAGAGDGRAGEGDRRRSEGAGRPSAGDAGVGGDPPDALCMTAAEIFGDTLNQVALLNGIPAEARSWRHGSIASRAAILPRLAADPRATARFERQVAWIKVAIFVAALTTSAWAAYEMDLWRIARSLATRAASG